MARVDLTAKFPQHDPRLIRIRTAIAIEGIERSAQEIGQGCEDDLFIIERYRAGCLTTEDLEVIAGLVADDLEALAIRDAN